MDKNKLRQIVKKLAKDTELLKNFEDIRVIDRKLEVLGFTDISNKILYVNIGYKGLSFADFVRTLSGLVIHEFGHIDKRLKVPSNLKRFKQTIRDLGGLKKVDRTLLNILYDLEIHYQYSKGKIKPTKRLKLKQFVTVLRNKVFKEDKEDLILSVEYPITDLQKNVKKIIQNRNISVRTKYKKIIKLLKKMGYSATVVTDIFYPVLSDLKEKKKKGKGKKKGKKPKSKPKKKIDVFKEESTSIKKDIENQTKEDEIRKRLSSMGFSDEEINALCQKYTVTDLLRRVDYLENSFNTVIPELTKVESKEKTQNHVKSKGQRINGYRKIRDFNEVVENPEDLLTIGKFDLDSIDVTVKIKRKTRGLIVLLRDVSGSVSCEPLDKMCRDTTVTLVKLAKSKNHRIGVIDFHSIPQPVKDRNGKVLTTDYNTILIDSMKFKTGYSTLLSSAIEYVVKLIQTEKLEKDNLNLYIVTDSYVDSCKHIQIPNKNVNIVGVWCSQYGEIDRNFTSLIKSYSGKIYKVEEIENKLVSTLLENFK